MSNFDINVDRRTDGLTDGRKIGCLYRTLLQAGAIKSRYVILYNQALPIFYTHERSWCMGHGGKMYAHGDVFFFVVIFFAI